MERVQREPISLDSLPKEHVLSFLQLAHELRSPLAVIINSLDVILQGYAVEDPNLQDQLLSRARERASEMLAQLNDFLRLGAVRHEEFLREPQPVQLLDVLEKLTPEMHIRARWRSVTLSIEAPDALARVRGTYEDMEHLLSNLINNAIKYTSPGGQVAVSFYERDGSVVGSVQDTGIGIPTEELPKIFDEFYRAKNAREAAVHGTGLGLSIVRRIVDRYGGEIHVTSRVGEGSTFTFAFPKHEGAC